MKFNYKFFSVFLVLLVIEIIIALFIRDNFIRPNVGDVIVVILIYFVVKSFFSTKSKLLPLYVFGFAVFVEILQYFNVVKLLGLENNRLARTIIGTTFDVNDIICYFIGCVILFLYQIIVEKYFSSLEATQKR